MTVPEASRHQLEIPPEVQSLLASIADARPSTVPARRIVEAILWLQGKGLGGRSERLIAHLVTEKNGYVGIVYGSARKWGRSGHDGFDHEDLAQDTILLMIEGLKRSSSSALNWSSFCYGRFCDAKRIYNGREGEKAIAEQAIKTAGTLSMSAAQEEESTSGNSRYVATAQISNSDVDSGTRRLDPSLANFLSQAQNRLGLSDQIGNESLDAWGWRVLEKIIARIPEDDVRLVASEIFCDDPPRLTGGPDDLGRLSLAAKQQWPAHKAKYRLKKAKVYVAERLIKDYIEGPGLNENDAVERAWLRDWYNHHLT